MLGLGFYRVARLLARRARRGLEQKQLMRTLLLKPLAPRPTIRITLGGAGLVAGSVRGLGRERNEFFAGQTFTSSTHIKTSLDGKPIGERPERTLHVELRDEGRRGRDHTLHVKRVARRRHPGERDDNWQPDHA